MEKWLYLLPELNSIDEPTKNLLLQHADILHFEAGCVVFSNGTDCDKYLIVLSGRVRVQQVSRQGREITLYHIISGEPCILTTTCLFSNRPYPAMGVTETETSVLAIPLRILQLAIASSSGFREFVFKAYGNRITDMLLVIEEIVFTRLDVRLAKKILSMTLEGDLIVTTHQDLAFEIGSVREVVSRVLGEFERRGWIRRGKKSLEITNRQALERLAYDLSD